MSLTKHYAEPDEALKHSDDGCFFIYGLAVLLLFSCRCVALLYVLNSAQLCLFSKTVIKPPMSKEANARIKINKLLEEAGWRFFDDEKGPANILLENYVKITQNEIDAWGNDYEKTKNGSLDFLLVDSNNKPFCVLEAKKESRHPLVAKEQARQYANTVGAQFIILQMVLFIIYGI
jgi:hypothetical protein